MTTAPRAPGKEPGKEPGREAAGRLGMVAITVVVEEAHRPATDAVCARLRAEGMRIEQVLTLLGLVTGELPEDRLPAVRRVEGVSSVGRQGSFRLPPPDAAVQ